MGEDEETNTPDSNDFGNLLLGKEIISYGGGTLAKTLKFRHDTYSRVVKHQLIGGATTEHQVDFGFQAGSGRLSTVTDNTNTARVFTYNYEGANAHLIKTVVGPVHTVTNSYEANRDILASKVNEQTLTTSYPSTFDYTVNSLGQRTNVGPVATIGGNNITTDHPVDWGWDYNGRGEVESADHGDDSVANAKDRFYKFDAIGNRDYLREGVYEDLNGTQRQYTANNLNEYGDVDTNGTQVTKGYDASGNMTSGQVPSYQGNSSALTWDAENRLIEAVVDGVTTTYEYDYMGRRIRKEVQGTSTVTTRYVYHGWNVCAEYTGTALNKTYTWGMDLSGSMQGAGGVGGLLMVIDDASGTAPDEYYPTYDGNGNVTEYLDSSGSVVAHYEYDAFGGEAAPPTGSLAGAFSHRFSTKYLDDETGLYYYGYRYFDPVTGRWPSRDPIEEQGGINLYAMVGNDVVNWWDVLGLEKQHPAIRTMIVVHQWWLSRKGPSNGDGKGQFDSYLYTLKSTADAWCYCGEPRVGNFVEDEDEYDPWWGKARAMMTIKVEDAFPNDKKVAFLSVSESGRDGKVDAFFAVLGALVGSPGGHGATGAGAAGGFGLAALWGYFQKGDGSYRYDFSVSCEEWKEGDPKIAPPKITGSFIGTKGVSNRFMSDNYIPSDAMWTWVE